VTAATDQSPMSRALAVIEAWAGRGRPFSANDLRPDLDAAGVTGPVVGRAFQQARADGVIQQVSMLGVVSSQQRTHLKRINEWTGA
jgi:hypothetical protein